MITGNAVLTIDNNQYMAGIQQAIEATKGFRAKVHRQAVARQQVTFADYRRGWQLAADGALRCACNGNGDEVAGYDAATKPIGDVAQRADLLAQLAPLDAAMRSVGVRG